MTNFTKRTTRIVAGTLAGAMALSVSPILGLTGIASAADALPPVADPTGAGNFCEGAPTTEPFTDVSATDPALDEIICLVATGLTTGVTPTTYEPNSPITRRQMALFIKRLADLANELEITPLTALPAYDGTPDFLDIAGESTAVKEAIGQLSQAEIVQGTTATTYSPRALVTRRQMAAFINRVQDFLAGDPFTTTGDFFDDDEGDPGEANLNALASKGIFQGDGAGNVNPGGNLTRRQMAFVLLRHLQVNFKAGAIKGAFAVGNATKTDRPELVSATIVQTTTQGTVIRFTFDEPLTGSFVTSGNFHVYNFATTDGVPVDSGFNAQIESGNTSSALATFTSINTASAAAALSVATVDEGAVRGISGAATDSNIIGDAPLNPGTTSQLTAGKSDAPDLVSVGNFRANPGDNTQTLIDFTFDEPAWDDCGGGCYDLVHVDGVNYNDSSDVIAGDGTAVHTVAFDNNGFTGGADSTVTILPAVVARGVIYEGSVDDRSDLAGNENPLQAADVSNSGNSETPDLVSAIAGRSVDTPAALVPTFGPKIDVILYTFDEPVIVSPVDTVEFTAYEASGNVLNPVPGTATRSTANDTQVAVVFGTAGTLDLAVGASVDWEAVQEATGTNRWSQEDEVGLANVGSGPTTVSGRTAGPDLTAVSVAERRDGFGTLIGARVTFTFDEDLNAAPGLLSIVLADGNRYNCADATVGTTEDTDNQVTCTALGAATTSQILSAAIGTVDNQAVWNQLSGTGPGTTNASADGGERNPEGAAIVTAA